MSELGSDVEAGRSDRVCLHRLWLLWLGWYSHWGYSAQHCFEPRASPDSLWKDLSDLCSWESWTSRGIGEQMTVVVPPPVLQQDCEGQPDLAKRFDQPPLAIEEGWGGLPDDPKFCNIVSLAIIHNQRCAGCTGIPVHPCLSSPNKAL